MSRVFIAGCGFVGLATARVFHAHGWEVVGGTHSAESAAALGGEPFRVVQADISDPETLARHGDLRGIEAVIHCASSGRGGVESYRSVYLAGVQNLAQVLAPAQLIFTSSTSVYAQVDGSWVTEDSAANPDRDTGRVLRAAEDFVVENGGTIARLAGIYGPGRSVLLKKFATGEAIIEGDGSRWVNQIHRDDIAAALFTLASRGERGVFNVSDDEPMTQRAVYAWLAGYFQKPLPPSGPIDPHRKRGWTSKRVSNSKMRALGWAPRYPSFRDAVTGDPEIVRGVGLGASA